MRSNAVGNLASLFVQRFVCHCGFADDQRRLAFGGERRVQCFAQFGYTVAVYGDHFPSPSTIFGSNIFAGHIADERGELHIVGIIEHGQIVQSEVPGYSSGALSDFFLNTAVGYVGINVLRHTFRPEALRHYLSGNGGTYCKSVALTEGAAGVFDAARYVTLGMTGRRASPLTELLQFVEGKAPL